METKKNKEADIEQIRASVFMIGLLFISSIVLIAFTYQTKIGDTNLSNINKSGVNNVYQQEEKKEETPPPVETPQVDVPPHVTEEIIEEENTEEEPITVVEVPPVVIAEETVIVEEEIIEFPDVEAEFKGGAQAMMKNIQQNIQYPPTSIEMNEQGKVYL